VAEGRCYRLESDGLVLTVRLTPRAARDALDGIGTLADGASVLLARVRALPAGGAANVALAALLAQCLHLSKSAVTITAGHTARRKQVRITGDPAALAEVIEGWGRSSD